MMQYLTAAVIKNTQIANGIWDMLLAYEDGDAKALAGKFISVYTGDTSKLLPRPISICDYDGQHLRLVFREAGGGTCQIAKFKAGDEVRIIAPIGNGFSGFIDDSKSYAVIGGGIGAPPMLLCVKNLKQPDVFLGFRDKSQVILTDDFSKYANVHTATDAGDYGTKGTVIDLLNASGAQYDGILACGPKPMLKAITDWAEAKKIPCYVSLEERMACSVGACLGCVVKIKAENGFEHKKICDCGPVFDARDVMWE